MLDCFFCNKIRMLSEFFLRYLYFQAQKGVYFVRRSCSQIHPDRMEALPNVPLLSEARNNATDIVQPVFRSAERDGL